MIYHSSIFSGVRFFLAGFPPPHHLEAKSKLVSEGGVYVEEYGPECTHVIVDNIVLDDPICVAAKRDKKVLVTSLWIDDSFDSGGPADPNSLLYCPPKDLNGIPGANKFFMSLTGFHGQERDDIRTMVGLMGAHFSKAMVAHKVTHLICLKFEGEKYELAKRIGSTKIVNMYWLEDCLKSWSLLPEEQYSKSTYEVRMEAEVKDSEDEAEAKDVIGRKTTGVTHLQTELGEAHNHSVLATKVSVPTAQQGFPKNSSINAEMLTESKNGNMPDKQSDMVTESVNDKLDKQPFQDYGDPSQMHTKTGYFDLQDVKSNQIENGLPSISGNAINSCDFDANLISNHSKTTLKTIPSSAKKTAQSNTSLKTSPSSSKPQSKTSLKTSPSSLKPQSKAFLKTSPSSSKPQSKTSMKTAGEYGKSDGRLSKDLAEKVVDEVPTFNLETDTEEAASGGFGGLSTEWLADSSAGKHSLSNSKESPSIFSLSLQSTRDLTCQDGKEDKGLSEKVIADVCTFNVGKAALASGTSSAEAGLFGVDLKDPGGKLPQKRAADSDVSHTTKSQKLASSTSKRVDAAEPKTRVNNPLKKSKTGVLNSGCQIADESAELSPYSSAKSNANNAAPSRSLSSDVLQGSKPANIEPLTSPNTKTSSPLLVDDNSKGKLQNRHENDADFSGTNDFKAVKSGSTKLNCVDSNGNVSKSSRKKMVARKTLGSRSKANKEKVDAQGVSISRSSEADDSVGQENREEFAPSPASDKKMLSSTAGELNHLGAKPHLDSSTKINHIADPLVDNTEDRPELDIRNEKLQTAEQSHIKMHVAETVGMAKNLGAQKKGRGIKANRKNLLAAKEASKDADNVEGGKSSSDKVKEPVHSVAVKKIQGLNKSKRSVEVENKLDFNAFVEVGRESEPVLNDQNVTKGVHCSGKLSLNKNRGVPVVNKPEDPVEVENDPLLDSNKGQSDGKKCPGKLTTSSNTAQGDEEDKNKNDPAVGNDKGTSKVAKCQQKLVGKKRRGTVLLKMSDGIDEEENEPVVQGDQHPRKLAASGILDRPEDDGKENDPFIGNSKGRIKGGKRAGNLTGKKRRGTLGLNEDEAHLTEEGKMNKSDEDQSKGGMLTEKLTSKSKLTANKNDASSALNTRELKEVKNQSACFILSGHRLQRKEFQKLIRNLRGKVCRDSHQWSYQASHFIVPDPIRRTEKFFAAAASGSWILKTDYLTASSQAGKFLPEEPYEWHKSGLNEDGAISLEAPRKWRLLRERTGHGAFYGMRIVIYGECIAPPLETLKRAVNAGDGTILATSPPYTRFLESGIDYAIISPGIPRVDIWIQEFLRHQIPCVLADYLVEYVCKPGYSLDRHVQYNTHEWAAKSSSKLLSLSEEVVVDAVPVTTPDDQVSDDLACQVCGSTDRAEVMLVCGNETGSIGCGIGTHIDCCNPPLEDVPEEDWFCPKCSEPVNKLPGSRKKKQFSQKI